MNKPIAASILFFASVSLAVEVKDADLAGNWYPASREELSSMLSGYLEDARPADIDGDIFAIISPHAGYRFSGPVAAYGFKAASKKKIGTVIVIGFSHRKSFDGISVYDRGAFRTPLGDIAVDEALAKNIASGHNRIFFYPDAFNGENSVEMQIPFIQLTWPGAKIVPIAFGTQSLDDARILAEAMTGALKGRGDYLIVASTDLSHYHNYTEAGAIDKHTIGVISSMKAKDLYEEAALRISELCGIMPVSATLLAAEKSGFDKIEVLRYANSGDTFGGKDSVVGYMSAVIYKKETRNDEREGKAMFNDAQRKKLLQIARESMTSFVRDGRRKSFKESDPALNAPLGAFVTLRKNGELRGCIGNMVGEGPLYETIANMAVEAACRDPRFMPVSRSELEKIDIEISVLSPLKRVSSHEEVKIPGDGVLVRKGFRSGVYLPQVAEEAGWNKEEFLTSLCGQKAGLSPDAWKDPATEMYVFTAEIFKEKGGKK